jgi:hypothetical protein
VNPFFTRRAVVSCDSEIRSALDIELMRISESGHQLVAAGR